MLTDSIQSQASQNRHPATFRRTNRFTAAPISAATRAGGLRPARAKTSGRPALEPAFDIEDAIRRFVESQPAQLYRGGA
ncbi:hypothetical protein [Thiocapsa bogorovii]|uniref:hypothetical protein n=1 Tax=Thiocapsa bogorovii TaxID=521689 RepID=UPI001E3DC2DA|nr:hypothetical protein [Thiocapsa bogorovii]UHD18498.1 hypothetical protein LT988_10910 [Thiocapsa bogorovii]